MAGSDLSEDIQRMAPDEDPLDVAMMIDLLANARSQRSAEVWRVAEEFAAKVLCILFDPVKTASYRSAIQQVRESYRGISDSRVLQDLFVSSLADELLTAPSVGHAVDRGVEGLFRQPERAR